MINVLISEPAMGGKGIFIISGIVIIVGIIGITGVLYYKKKKMKK
ncbi:MAG: hypothetical protein ACYCT7_08590 [bacterium]